MVKWSVIGLGIVIIILFFGLPKMLGIIGIQIPEFFHSSHVIISILTAGILIAFSGFIPYKWGKIFRNIAYFILFILIIFIEMSLLSPYVSVTPPPIDECEKFFQGGEGKLVGAAATFISCVFTGYHPADYSNYGLTVFFVFYFILPFAYIWVLIYGLMMGIGMETWFGAFGDNAVRILSFIITMYATRVVFGAVLLEFLGYGAWGLAGVFGAVILVKGLQTLMERWYAVEEMAEETKKSIETELTIGRAYARSAKPIIDTAKGSAIKDLQYAKTTLGKLKNIPLWNLLSKDQQNYLDQLINLAQGATSPEEFKKRVGRIEKFVKDILGQLRKKLK